MQVLFLAQKAELKIKFARRSEVRFTITNFLKINQNSVSFKSNQIESVSCQIKSSAFEIDSRKASNRDLNRIAIWFAQLTRSECYSISSCHKGINFLFQHLNCKLIWMTRIYEWIHKTSYKPFLIDDLSVDFFMEHFFISPPIAVIFFGKAADNTHKNALPVLANLTFNQTNDTFNVNLL